MIVITTINETKHSFDTEVHIEGEGQLVCKELIAIFDVIYHNAPELFEAALVSSQYTEDHT